MLFASIIKCWSGLWVTKFFSIIMTCGLTCNYLGRYATKTQERTWLQSKSMVQWYLQTTKRRKPTTKRRKNVLQSSSRHFDTHASIRKWVFFGLEEVSRKGQSANRLNEQDIQRFIYPHMCH